MRTGDVVVLPQRLTDADGDRLFADVEVGETGHQRASVEIVDALFEQPDRPNLSIEAQQRVLADLQAAEGLVQLIGRHGHAGTPDICASTWKMDAKSFSVSPIARAAVRYSFATAVAGSGPATRRPISSASVTSFCIIRMSNHASSGGLITIGPRYCTIGEAMTLLVSTSTAVLRGMPAFSASSTASWTP